LQGVCHCASNEATSVSLLASYRLADLKGFVNPNFFAKCELYDYTIWTALQETHKAIAARYELAAGRLDDFMQKFLFLIGFESSLTLRE